jgi:hypothetical protein
MTEDENGSESALYAIIAFVADEHYIDFLDDYKGHTLNKLHNSFVSPSPISIPRLGARKIKSNHRMVTSSVQDTSNQHQHQ